MQKKYLPDGIEIPGIEKYFPAFFFGLFLVFILAGCTTLKKDLDVQPDTDPTDPVEVLLEQMSLDEKLGQMTQVSNKGVRPGDIRKFFLGSILSGGGGSPSDNSVAGWVEMVDGFQKEALDTRLSIPLIYGVDAVHGHGNLRGATIFPHQIGLGATRNPELIRQIGQAAAIEMRATGIPWNFAPVVAVPQDIRWGRTYEAYGEDPALVEALALAYQEGLQVIPADKTTLPGQTLYVLATPKHFIGDGGTEWGSSTTDNYSIDQGDMILDEAAVRERFLLPYISLVEGGALSIMPSYSSWKGTKLHASSYWLDDVLRGELGFSGFVISDWNAIDQVNEDYYQSVVIAINAGVDMGMISSDFKGFINTLKKAVENRDISEERIDQAVRRILQVKFALGLFEQPFADPDLAEQVGSDLHRQLARQAVRESLVLLRNEDNVLPLSPDLKTIYVAGQAANDIGLQSGGWTINWQGGLSAIQPGTTILEGIQNAVSPGTVVEYRSNGQFEGGADVAILVVGEFPYAEGQGDKADLGLSVRDQNLIETMREKSDRLIVIIISGRPLIITDHYLMADAWVAAWLPGTEGHGVADVLFGGFPFTGRLPYTWPRSNDQIPINIFSEVLTTKGCESPLFPFGYGLGETGLEPIAWMDCSP